VFGPLALVTGDATDNNLTGLVYVRLVTVGWFAIEANDGTRVFSLITHAPCRRWT
jgi:hypothetical protein